MKSLWIGLSVLCVLFPGASFPPASPLPALAVVPSRGHPGQIIKIVGVTPGAKIVKWDDALPTRLAGPPSSSSERFVQIPRTIHPGTGAIGSTTVHTLEMTDMPGSPPLDVRVVLPAPSAQWPDPRIEDIGIRDLRHPPAIMDVATVTLAVSVANADPDAVVEVNGQPVPTEFVSAITGDFVGTAGPAKSGYPIYHIALLSATLQKQTLGETVSVVVFSNNVHSKPCDYVIATLDKLDSDGDGLLDEWELNGYTAPDGSKIDLKAMGCDPHRKDILVEVDWMQSAQPDLTIFNKIESIFNDDAMVLNPDGSRGISLHIDHGQGGQFTGGGTILQDYKTMDFCTVLGDPYNVRFGDLKSIGFTPNRPGIFHYCIFGNAQPGMSTGSGEIWGDDFYVTLTMIPNWKARPDIQIGTFMHELGHNIGLRHGGIDNDAVDEDITRKPNQESVMNYVYQFGLLPPLYKALPQLPGGPFTYSTGRSAPLIAKVRGHEVNSNGDKTLTLINYDEWGHLKLNFRDPNSQQSQDANSCCATITYCATVIWDVKLSIRGGSPTPETTRLVRTSDNLTVEAGLCQPPPSCGDTISCVSPGNYRPSVLLGTSTYVLTGAHGDTIVVPTDVVGFDSVQVVPGDTVRIFIRGTYP